LVIDLPVLVRKKLWAWLERFDDEVGAPESSHGRGATTTILKAVEGDLKIEHGWDALSGLPLDDPGIVSSPLHNLVLKGHGHLVLDIVELAHGYMGYREKDEFEQKVNKVLQLHRCPWHFSRGEFFKLDRDFVRVRLSATASEALVANDFVGAADEYAKCRQELGSGDVKDAIFYAGKSLESVLKVMTGQKHANATQLIDELLSQGFLDDLPEDIRQGFAQQVMRPVPFLRNKLGGHGQGVVVTEVPPVYGTLAVQLAGAIHNFLIAKHIEHRTSDTSPETEGESLTSGDIPF